MSENRSGEVLTAFIIGGLVGAIIGILFAPAAGKVTRQRIGDWLEEKKEEAKQAIERLEEEIRRKKEELSK